MEHVRVRDHDLPGLADRRADRRRRVPVVAGRRDLEPGVLHQLPELRHLVLAERLGGEQEQRPCRRVLGQRLEDGHRVAQRLAGRGGRHHDDVPARVHGLDRVRLVGVRALDAALRQPGPDPRVQPVRPVSVLRRRAPRGPRGGRRRGRATAPRAAGPARPGCWRGRRCACRLRSDIEQMIELDGSLRQRGQPVCHLGCHRPCTNRSAARRNRAARFRVDSGIERSYPRSNAPPSRRPDPATPETATSDALAPEPGAVAPTPVAAGALGSLADLPVAGLTRRRIALLIGALVAAWVIVLFARQVGEASEATARADAMRVANVQLEAEVSALEAELELIQKQAYIAQAAREYRLGQGQRDPVRAGGRCPGAGRRRARVGAGPARHARCGAHPARVLGPPAVRRGGGGRRRI